LVRSFAKVLQEAPQSRLVRVGDGELLLGVQSLAKDLGVAERIEFKMALAHEDVCTLMQQSGCFVQYSVRAGNGDSEGTPVAVMEAMMMGLPVVATAHAGIKDIIEYGKTGLLVDEYDVNAMAQAILRIVREPELAKRLGKEARYFALQNLAMSKSIEKLSQILGSSVEDQTLLFPQQHRQRKAV
jgi:glycosyltransferase involved in cell wall biosynthesis